MLTGKPEKYSRQRGGYSTFSRGEISDVERLRSLPALPGAVTDLTAIKDYFPAGSAVLFLGPEATEYQVKHDPDARKCARIRDAFIDRGRETIDT